MEEKAFPSNLCLYPTICHQHERGALAFAIILMPLETQWLEVKDVISGRLYIMKSTLHYLVGYCVAAFKFASAFLSTFSSLLSIFVGRKEK